MRRTLSRNIERLSWILLVVVSLPVCSSLRPPPPGRVDPRTSGVCGANVPHTEKTVVLLYYKPPGLITSHSNKDAAPAGELSRKTVYDDIMSMKGCVVGNTQQSFEKVTGIRSKIHAVGRLDAETSGLLLLTNDGGLVHHVTNPNPHERAKDAAALVEKTYEALIMGHYDNDAPDFEMMRLKGVDIGTKYGGMTRPVQRLRVLDHPTSKSTLVSITICEGKNRQVRRMFHAIRSGVIKLKRTNLGSKLTLDGLQEGQWRLLTNQEIKDGLNWEPRKLVVESSSTNSRNSSGKRKSKYRSRFSQKN